MIFNESSLKGIVIKGSRYVVSDESRPGFAIKVSALGSAAFYYRYRKGTAKKEVPLGTEFAHALALYRVLFNSTSKVDGAEHSPVEVDSNSMFFPSVTLPMLVKAYYEQHVIPHMSVSSHTCFRAYLSNLEAYAKSHAPKLYYGQCDIMQGREHIKDLLLTVIGSAPILCNRMRSCYSGMFKWGSRQRKLVRDNPIFNMPAGLEKPKHRRLEPMELEVFLPMLSCPSYMMHAQDAIKTTLLTCLRPGEVLGIRNKDIRKSLTQDGVYNLHITQNKSNVEHIVPLSDTAYQILQKHSSNLPNERLFKLTVDRLWTVCKRLCKQANVTECGSHDMRRTAATLCASLGVPKEIIPLLLNHAPVGVTERHYAMYSYLPERRAALMKLAEALKGLGLVV